MASNPQRLETRVVHAGDPHPRIEGAVTLPIFQSTVFEQEEGAGYHELRYPRLNNLPNHEALAGKLADLEGGEAALVTASGMAAISTTLLTVLGGGGHLLVQDCLYGGTHNLLTDDLGSLGMSYAFIDARDPGSWKSSLRTDTRAVYVEGLSNPLLQVADHRAIVRFAHDHGLLAVIDNTFASPINFRPLELGFDLVLHSCTKYLNGHSDLAAGALIGRADWVERVLHRLNHLGGSLDPHACFLLNRGIKTLALRVRQQNTNALAIARHLSARPEVTVVNYPGIETHPDHRRARELFSGFGGMLSFELAGGAEAARRLARRVTLFTDAPSLGGVESLVTRPVATTHAGMSTADRQRLGISDGLLRLSIGIEAVEDLIADLDAALKE